VESGNRVFFCKTTIQVDRHEAVKSQLLSFIMFISFQVRKNRSSTTEDKDWSSTSDKETRSEERERERG